MEESKELQKLYTFTQSLIYFSIIIEIIVFCHFPFLNRLNFLIAKIGSMPIYDSIIWSKLFTFILIVITSIGTKSRKKIELNVTTHIYMPLLFGIVVFISSIIFLNMYGRGLEWYNIVYIVLSFLGAILINVAFDNISKMLKSNFMKDPFNKENESFLQTTKLVNTEHSVNIPMLYYWKKKMQEGWINIVNPFRGTFVIGTPGSGKTFLVINSFIRQHSAKGFALVVYDYKYPDLGKITYYNFLKNKKKGIIGKNFKFNVINFSDVEYSRRVNPLKREYIETLSDATETAEALYESLQKGDREGGSSGEFFKVSAINFLAANIYFFSRYKGGKYSDLPHVLAFMNRSYQEIFNVLFSEPELQSLLSPFKSAYEAGAVDQLEGQIGSLKVQISRLATKESFWIFSGHDFNLKVSDKNEPSYLIIANNPKTQSMNSALNALIINRITRLVNTDGNLPSSIIIDEAPTLYFHQLGNLLSTARSRLVSVCLGLQEIPQFEKLYGKGEAKSIMSVIGNILSGSARSKETLEWLQTVFGKVKQVKEGISVQKNNTTVSYNEQMDYLIPASKIASLHAGSIVGQVALDFGQEKHFPTTTYHCKGNLDIKSIKIEESNYVDLPKFYNFGGSEKKEKVLQKNFKKIYDEVDTIVQEYDE